ncbi:hypothetical protein ACFSKI_14910 [Pseudogracilibacillus auburnensis]|uniref:Uncharacterized protein n=1 Tax=Pseudogracilibacillus auburnensis TaxID=1494959 RepID=A0A2V3VSU1_9BACI|nr:hypothetical protein [Pseudogracilibacillus auburnensis]MBO1001346.1 hypothetical protein [Pseudogracilibacillus auburnensis]PXW83778.1 hypothetical protein DFR56_11463 [Pseudogracilibacillus auburnensis]
MKGTALLINEDQSVTVLENVDHSVYEELANEEDLAHPHCTIGDKEVEFDPIFSVVWHEEAIDWDYGY